MAAGNLRKCLDITLSHEGGLSVDRRDPGNWTGGKVGHGVLKGTKYGVAASAHPSLDIRNLTKSDVEPIYWEKYWLPICGDQLPAGIDLAVFDYGVNSGPERSIKALQKVVGADQDGVIGPLTLRRAQLLPPVDTIKRHCASRMSFLRGLRTWQTFGRGWSRRVADIEARAVSMALTAEGLPPAVVKGRLEEEQVRARVDANNKTAAAGGAGAAGGLSSGAEILYGDFGWVGLALAVLLVVAAIYLAIRVKHSLDRADAYGESAKRM
ncbi:glycoside hydrolase family 108 protein [Gellertiella hungarica]|uniref:Lysozyme family protein n=1 Tax=Gellertiella hungarica TaxID=1572859 RepID=A0A7W6NML6_9HYPH|nr:glycoside hydrolase family 108 protein [Gellertiella hungarica]MBB4066744.1 lysozyme family protein [Gellertiella hungarica]